MRNLRTVKERVSQISKGDGELTTSDVETAQDYILDEGYGIDVIYLDYRKAFDTVPHTRLIEKVKAMGINGNIVGWNS